MNFLLADIDSHKYYPLTLTRPVALLRVGILTLQEKWEKLLKTEISTLAQSYLQRKYSPRFAQINTVVDASLLPDANLIEALKNLALNTALQYNGKIIACCVDAAYLTENQNNSLANAAALTQVEYKQEINKIEQLTDLFKYNDKYIKNDFELLTNGRESAELSSTNTLVGNQLFIEKGAKVSCSILNTETGPIYIDEGAEIMEGCMLRGPIYIGKGAVIKMGAKIYGACTFGPECRVGGEVSNSVMQGYSNKGHDGFLGNSILGEWCNLGADTNTSNLKNNYREVKIWDFEQNSYTDSGLQFCGLLMGDHAKSAINTQFNTGTTVGVFANVFKSGFPEKYIPSFSWLGDKGNEKYQLEKAFDVAQEVMNRRHIELSDADKAILTHLFLNRE